MQGLRLVGASLFIHTHRWTTPQIAEILSPRWRNRSHSKLTGGRVGAFVRNTRWRLSRGTAQSSAIFTSALNFHPNKSISSLGPSPPWPCPFIAIDVAEAHSSLIHLLLFLLSVPCLCLFGGHEINVGEHCFIYPPLHDFCGFFFRPKQTTFSEEQAWGSCLDMIYDATLTLHWPRNALILKQFDT